MKRPRILLADNHAMICARFQKLLGRAIDPAGTLDDWRDLAEFLKSTESALCVNVTRPFSSFFFLIIATPSATSD
jgi:hypothetical protein